MYNTILTSIEDRIFTITINRENKLNALNRETLRELHHAFTEAYNNTKVGGIIITGAGTKAFVAGADISELRDLDEAEAFKLASECQLDVFNLIENGSKPVIAAINGFALGGGLELAMACHIRVSSENAQFGLPEVSLGLIPGYGGTQRLPQLIGKGKAFELILTGEMISASAALNLGLLNYVVPMNHLLTTATNLMKKILNRSSTAVQAAIKSINSGYFNSGFEVEIQQFSACFNTEDFKEGTSAFLEKRQPKFKY